MITFICIVCALALDKLLGEASRFHPLVGFGNLAICIEKIFNRSSAKNNLIRFYGVLAWCLVVMPITCGVYYLQVLLADWPWLNLIFSSVILYVAIGWTSLLEHAFNISRPLNNNNLADARKAVSMIVSRDTQNLDESGIAKAATESVLENGADAIFSALFWFVIAGIPGVVLYRLSNTLDAMWGYKNSRFLYFGWCAARIDDVLNFLPARLTALSYALVGNTRLALQCWSKQGFTWKSPNAGPVMAAGAGALNVSLGGAAQYHCEQQYRPALGPIMSQSEKQNDTAPSARSIEQAIKLVNHVLFLWLLVLSIGVLIIGVLFIE